MKLTRMTLGTIESLVAEGTVIDVGDGTIRASFLLPRYIGISYHGKTIKIEPNEDTQISTNQVFLEVVERALKEEKLFVANVVYRPKDGFWGFPHQIKGRIYREV